MIKYYVLIPYILGMLACKSSSNENAILLAKGKEITSATQAVLAKNLKNAIQTQGVENALSFCSTRALSLTDSMALELDADLKRVSDKNRNPNNLANADEIAYINQAKATLEKGELIQPLIQSVDGKAVGYYPILTNSLCLQCHGVIGKDVNPLTHARITEIYRKDKAVGYSENELRGIWVVEF